jgi:hypothetical protein
LLLFVIRLGIFFQLLISGYFPSPESLEILYFL